MGFERDAGPSPGGDLMTRARRPLGRALIAAAGAACLHGCAAAGGPPRAAANGDYVLALGTLSFEVAPAGARVVDVRLPDGVNLLTGPSVDSTNFGATFWTSPQSAWGWPPPASFDTAPYQVSGSESSLTFSGPADGEVGAQIAKRFTAGPAAAQVDVEYRITAVGGDREFAPWEITRVFPGGLTFFPTGAGAPRAGGGFALPPTRQAAGCTWYQHPGVAPGADQKLLADGAGGWLAHVAGDVVLIKKFADVPDGAAAPGEAEIEIFVDGQGRYVEVEEQGAYRPVAEGQTLVWPVTWFVRRLPAGLNATAGSADLVAFVQALVSR
jgi:hypothetical protein